MQFIKRLRWFMLAAGLMMAIQAAQANPVTRIVVPYAAGGTIDMLARQLAPQLAAALGETVIVENRPGANGILATRLLAATPTDGNSLLFASTSQIAINPYATSALGVDPLRAFQVVGGVSKIPHVIEVSASESMDWKALVAKAKSPGGLNYASAGIGSTNHLAGELISDALGVHLTHVPYKGSGAALPDVVGGQVAMMIDQVPSSLAFIRAGRLQALAVTTAERIPQLPNVPTLKELGVNVEPVVAWNLLLLPAGVPRPRADALVAALVKARSQAQFKAFVESLGGALWTSDPSDVKRYLEAESTRWKALILKHGIKVE